MVTARPHVLRAVTAALDASPSRVVLLTGPTGAGRTSTLHAVRALRGVDQTCLIPVDRLATTPERFLEGLGTTGLMTRAPAGVGARAAFDAAMDALAAPHATTGTPVLVLLDELLELRTFDSFPHLRGATQECVERLAASGRPCVVTSRFSARATQLLAPFGDRVACVELPPLTVAEVTAALHVEGAAPDEASSLAETVQALTLGHPAYVAAMAEALVLGRHDAPHGGDDPVSALARLLQPDGRLARQCEFVYEWRLHRARGYGALKEILHLLAEEDGLTLSEVARRLRRTPGSTKDYLQWLQDVDLVAADRRRYRFVDPLLRAWVRIYGQATPADDVAIVREVQRFALSRLSP